MNSLLITLNVYEYLWKWKVFYFWVFEFGRRLKGLGIIGFAY